MASVSSPKLWINLASDPSQSWSFEYITGIQSQPTVPGVTQTIDAAGNVGATTAPGQTLTYPVTLVACDAERRYALEVLLPGKTIWVRDGNGRKFGAVYTTVQITEHMYNLECDIAVTFNLLTLPEA